MTSKSCLRWTVTAAVVIIMTIVSGVQANDGFAPAVSRIEIVLANQYRHATAELREEFAKAGFHNAHFQFVKRGQPPQNIGLGRDVTADQAREVIRLALKYNLDVNILLPERLFPPRFVTIASSNFDDTVEYPIDRSALVRLQDPDLTTEAFHRLYRELTSVPLNLKGRY